jgi:uncharacterized membrane protein YkvA (DUF1232 family)
MRVLKEMFIVLAAVVSVIYLINPTAGLLEFIPDNFPILGNLDEAAAVLILLNTLRYYGLDLTKALYRRDNDDVVDAPNQKNSYSR